MATHKETITNTAKERFAHALFFILIPSFWNSIRSISLLLSSKCKFVEIRKFNTLHSILQFVHHSIDGGDSGPTLGVPAKFTDQHFLHILFGFALTNQRPDSFLYGIHVRAPFEHLFTLRDRAVARNHCI